MADRLITREMAQAHIRDHCPERHDVSRFGQGSGTEWLCGCGRCPTPDPTPEEYRRKVEEAAWRRASVDDRNHDYEVPVLVDPTLIEVGEPRASDANRRRYVALGGRYLNAGYAHEVQRMQGDG